MFTFEGLWLIAAENINDLWTKELRKGCFF